jgi:FkbM family methyltransferase
VTATSFYGVELGGADSAAVSTAELMQVFEILKPKATKTPLIRIGGDHDGAYLVPDDLDGIEACFSPGANRVKYFEDFLTDRYGIKSYMADFSCDVDEFKTPLREGMQTFLKKWLDVTPGEDNISLKDWIRDNDVSGDLLLQMDIEGAEYRNVLATPDDTLARFRVVVLEVHGLRAMLDGPSLRGAIAPFFDKLARNFTTVHAHPNNCCGDFVVPGTDVRIPHVLELTLVRNDRFSPASAGPPSLPHPLDVSRNIPRKPPLFLNEAWVDHQRPLESRVKILEDVAAYRDATGATADDSEFASVLSMTMRSLQTIASPAKRSGEVVEVAEGRPFQLSSAYGTFSRTGVVKPSDSYFFHTGFGTNQSIRVDLGSRRRVRRIEVTNRRNGYQYRAMFLFAVLSSRDDAKGGASVFPMYQAGELPGGAWRECAIELPDVEARYVTITCPVTTALHFADLRIYAAKGGDRQKPAGGVTSLVRRAARRAPRPVKAVVRRAVGRAPRSTRAVGVRGSGSPTGPTPSAEGTGEGASAGKVASGGKGRLYVLDACAIFEVPVSGLIHVGANRADEYPTYHRQTHGPLLYIEALPELAERARRQLDPKRPHYLREALVSDVAGEKVAFHVASNDGGSSSMFEPGRHAEVFPWITFDSTLELVTERLDDIVAERPEAPAYNVLVLDVQGAELKVLKGAPKLLENVDAVFTEVSSEPLYDGGCTFLEVTNLLAKAGFVFRTAEMNADSWGDAFYSRPRTALHEMLGRNLAHGKPTRQSSHYGARGSERLVGDMVPKDYGVHTAVDDASPWWEVDLGSPNEISRIIYLDRAKYLERATSLRISTSVDGERYDVVYRREGKALKTIIDIGTSVTARYVRVSLESGGPLHFRQLIVV